MTMNYVADLIRVIQKPPDERSDAEINNVMPWIHKISQPLSSLEHDILVNILRNSRYEKVKADSLLTRQNARSNCLFVLLSGKAVGYVTESSHGEGRHSRTRKESKLPSVKKNSTAVRNASLQSPPDPTPFITESNVLIRSDPSTEIQSHESSRKVSTQSNSPRQITNHYESGASFDETSFFRTVGASGATGGVASPSAAASASASTSASASVALCSESVLTVEDCELLVIDREVYEQVMAEHEAQELDMLKNSIENCYIFSGWFKKYKNVIESSLKKEVVERNNVIIKQGDDADKLILIHSGMVQISTHIDLHVDQFEEFFTREIPKMKFDDDMAGMSQDDDQIASLYFKVNIEESVRLSFKPLKVTDVAILQPNSVIGDFEVCLNLPIHAFTYTALTRTVLYILDREVLERIYNDRNRFSAQFLNTTVKMVQTIEDRINSRFELNSSLKEELLIFRRALTYIGYLKYLIKKQQRRGKTKSATAEANQVTASDQETDQLLKLYLANHLQLIRPFVKTALNDWTYHHSKQPFWRHKLHEKGKDQYSLTDCKSDKHGQRPRSTQELQREYSYTHLRDVGLRPIPKLTYAELAAYDDEQETGMNYELEKIRQRVIASQMTKNERLQEFEQSYKSFDFDSFTRLFSKFKDSQTARKISTSGTRRSAAAASTPLAVMVRPPIYSEKETAASNAEMSSLESKINDFLSNVNHFAHPKAGGVLSRLTEHRESNEKSTSNQQHVLPSKKSIIRQLKREQVNPAKLPKRGTTVLLNARHCPCRTSEPDATNILQAAAEDDGIVFVHDHVRSIVVPPFVIECANNKAGNEAQGT